MLQVYRWNLGFNFVKAVTCNKLRYSLCDLCMMVKSKKKKRICFVNAEK